MPGSDLLPESGLGAWVRAGQAHGPKDVGSAADRGPAGLGTPWGRGCRIPRSHWGPSHGRGPCRAGRGARPVSSHADQPTGALPRVGCGVVGGAPWPACGVTSLDKMAV